MIEPQVSEAPIVVGKVGEDLRAPRAAGVAGLAFAVLFVASLLLLRHHPGVGSSAEEIADWYLREHGRRVAIVGLGVVILAMAVRPRGDDVPTGPSDSGASGASGTAGTAGGGA